MKDCLLYCLCFKHKHIILITTFKHFTFSSHYLVFVSVHSNNLKNDLLHLLCKFTLNNSLNSKCFILNLLLAEYQYSFMKVVKVFKYFINCLIHFFSYNFIYHFIWIQIMEYPQFDFSILYCTLLFLIIETKVKTDRYFVKLAFIFIRSYYANEELYYEICFRLIYVNYFHFKEILNSILLDYLIIRDS